MVDSLLLKQQEATSSYRDEFSTWSDIKDGVAQGSILGPLIFNIHICDLFYIIRKWPIANYVHDTTPYHGGKNTQEVITSLETSLVR